MSNLLTIVGLQYLNTSETTTMNNMFAVFSSLSTINVSGFDTRKVTNMYGMFNNCSSLRSIDVSKFNTENVTDMSFMFGGCTSLEKISVSSFNTKNVKYMSNMFSYCSALTTLDVSTFNVSSLISIPQFAQNSTGITKLIVGNLDFSSLDSSAKHDAFTGIGTSASPAELVTYEKFNKNVLGNKVSNGAYTWLGGTFKLTTTSGVPAAVKSGGGTSRTLTFTIVPEEQIDNSTVYSLPAEGETYPKWTSSYSEIATVVFSPMFASASPVNTGHWFSDMKNLETIKDIKYLNTASVKTMDYMFNGCVKLTSLDLSTFDTGNVTAMNNMFYRCTALETLDISSFTIKPETNVSLLASGCTALKEVSVGANDFKVITTESNKDNAFYNVGSTTPANLIIYDSFDTEVLGEKDNSGVYTWLHGRFNLITMQIYPVAVLSEDESTLTFTQVPEAKIDNVTTFAIPTSDNTTIRWSGKSSNITKVVFKSSFAGARPYSTAKWFRNMTKLNTIEDFENLNTSETTAMNEMFYGCVAIKELDLSHFNTQKVTTMASMFSGCTRLSDIRLNGFNTVKVKDMTEMFNNCKSLTSLDISDFTFTSSANVANMAKNCTGVRYLSVGSNDLTAITTDSKKANAFSGVGTASKPANLSVAADFTQSVLTASGNYYTWLGGYFSAPTVYGLILDENKDYTYSSYNSTGENIRLRRKFKANTWYTLVLPFNLTHSQANNMFYGADVAYFTNSTDNTIELNTNADSKAIEANVPVLIRTSVDVENPVLYSSYTLYNGKPVVNGDNGINFVGNCSASYTLKAGEYFIKDNELWESEGNTSSRATHAYFTVSESARGKVSLIIDGTPVTTGIEDIHVVKAAPTGAVYNTNGIKVANSLDELKSRSVPKGIYIVGGKKMVIK